MDFELIRTVFPFFLKAAWVTVQLSVLTAILGLICGSLGRRQGCHARACCAFWARPMSASFAARRR